MDERVKSCGITVQSHMNTVRKLGSTLALTLGLALPLAALVGCEPDTPAEELGEAVDDALDGRDTPAENAAEAIEDTADEVGEAVNQGAENVERRIENVGDNDMN